MQHLDFVIAAMLKCAQDHQLLEDYQDDLVKHDRRVMEMMDGWRAFGWVVSKTSSDVYPLGLHQGFNDDILHIAKLRVPSGAKCFWVNPERAKHEGSNVIVPVDLQAFERGVRSARCYSYDKGLIQSQSGTPVASLRWDAMACGLSGVVTCLYEMQGLLPSFSRNWGEQFALREVTKRHGVWVRLFNKQEYLESQKKAA